MKKRRPADHNGSAKRPSGTLSPLVVSRPSRLSPFAARFSALLIVTLRLFATRGFALLNKKHQAPSRPTPQLGAYFWI